METCIIFIVAGLSAVWLLLRCQRKFSRHRVMKSFIIGLLFVNGAVIAASAVVLLTGAVSQAQETGPAVQQAEAGRQGQPQQGGGNYKEIAAALAVGLSSLAAGIAVAVTGSAAIGGMAQNPEIFGRSLVFVGLAEGIAIYGLIISFMILMGFGGGGGGG